MAIFKIKFDLADVFLFLFHWQIVQTDCIIKISKNA